MLFAHHHQFPSVQDKNDEAVVHTDEDLGAVFLYTKHTTKPYFTPGLLTNLTQALNELETRIKSDIALSGKSPIKYLVAGSTIPNIFNLGGDLELFVELIHAGDREGLLRYGRACIDLTYRWSKSLDLPVTTIAVVEGTAQGGGFETVLASNFIIAERGTRLGFPEVLFNMFPGMGAYQFLAQRVNPVIAERLILSGRLYLAEDLYEMGVIDSLAEPGCGHDEAVSYIRNCERRTNAHNMIRHVRSQQNGVSYANLQEVVNLWVDAALGLSDLELRFMQRLVRSQKRN